MAEPTFANGKINYEELIKSYARDHDMTFGEAIKFVATRQSLECAATLLGVDLTMRRSAANREKLNQLGEFLDRKGFTVPRLWDEGDEQYVPRETTCKPSIVKAQQKKAAKPKRRYRKMRQAQDITKDRYLEMRLQGLTRTEAMKQLGLSAVTFYAFLRQWGIKDRIVEERLLDSLRGGQAPTKLSAEIEVSVTTETDKVEPNSSSYEQSYTQVVDKSTEGEELYVTVRVPIRAAYPMADAVQKIRDNLNNPWVRRDQLFRLGMDCLCNAVAWAYKELVEIVGEGRLDTLQAYVDRKCAEVVTEDVTPHESREAV
jgi:hypothetical protein